jgi:hypothetical protein
VLFTRIIDVLCDGFDPVNAETVTDRQLAGAERLLETAVALGRDRCSLRLSRHLAVLFAARGAFGAWGRVLAAMRTAAERLGDRAALALAEHELGVRAVLLGDNATALRCLHSAARERSACGDEAGAAASNAALALADRSAGPTASAVSSKRPTDGAHDGPSLRASGTPSDGAFIPPVAWLLTLFACCVVVSAFAGLALRHRVSAPPEIRVFSAHPVSLGGTRAFQLCVDAANTAVVEIFPDATRLPGEGAHCALVRPLLTTTYVAVGTAADGGRVQRAVTVAVHDAPGAVPRIAAFSAIPPRIEAGQSTRLCYAVTGAHLLRLSSRHIARAASLQLPALGDWR